jgi:simple sugar transport system ATP-binding protein
MPVLEMREITKRFGALVANDRISFDIEAGEVHALLGENGAGKSTLMKILYGLYQPDEGEIFIRDQHVSLKSPADAIAQGIGFVSQHFALIPTFTVTENVILGHEKQSILQHAAMRRQVVETAERLRFNIDPDAIVGHLSVGQQQRVEILKALYRGCRILILDEPTAVLTPQDTEKLFSILIELQRQGLSVVIITHKLNEVFAISQRVTVLRLGKVVGRTQTANTSQTELSQMMVGRQTIPVTRNTDHHAQNEIRLNVQNLIMADRSGAARLRGLSLNVRAQEIVGVAGVAGNGQSELVDVLTGMAQPQSGTIEVHGQAMPFGKPGVLSQLKMARIPEDRLKGVIGDLSVADNLMLEQVGQFTRAGHLNRKQIREYAERLIRDFQIKAAPDDPARTLSGGNIQKIILARSLAQNPEVVIAAQPTRGLDIGATEYVHQKLLEQKQRGAAVLLISEDLDEILALSDRVLVIFEGVIAGEFDANETDIDVLGALMTGASVEKAKTYV